MVLITTAGKVGSEAARLLAQRGEPVRILVRDPDKATRLAQTGAEIFVEISTYPQASMKRCMASRACYWSLRLSYGRS